MKANRKFILENRDAAFDIRTVGLLAAFFLIIIVTVMVYWNIASNIEGPTSEANETINKTNDMFGTVWGLLPIVGLVVVAAIIIKIVLTSFV